MPVPVPLRDRSRFFGTPRTQAPSVSATDGSRSSPDMPTPPRRSAQAASTARAVEAACLIYRAPDADPGDVSPPGSTVLNVRNTTRRRIWSRVAGAARAAARLSARRRRGSPHGRGAERHSAARASAVRHSSFGTTPNESKESKASSSCIDSCQS